MGMESKKITFLGHFGAGNLGNECTLQAIIERALRRWPEASLQCGCTDPKDVESRHNIPAFYWSVSASRRNRAAVGGRLRAAVMRIFGELGQFSQCLRRVWWSDMLIVCGTQIVSDNLTGPKGWPYELFKWSMLAALCRVKVLFIGIGVGPIDHPVSRWLIKRSLGFASYRSYRDKESRQYMEAIGFNTDRDSVCPDLAFGLSCELLRSKEDRARQRRVVGVGLGYIAGLAEVWTKSHQDYIKMMADFVCWLVEHDYNVRLLIGDFHHDVEVREEVVNAIKGRVVEVGRVVAEPILSVEELLRQLDETDLVISSRFHNLVLALLLNRPVIALSYQAKFDALMAELGLSDYCLPLGTVDVGSLTKLFEQLQNDAERLKPHIRNKIEKFREALDEQYAVAFAEV
jgi:polysaccharide pyruvyl transferase WcaK-like protein